MVELLGSRQVDIVSFILYEAYPPLQSRAGKPEQGQRRSEAGVEDRGGRRQSPDSGAGKQSILLLEAGKAQSTKNIPKTMVWELRKKKLL